MFIEVFAGSDAASPRYDAGGAERVCASPLVLNLGSAPPSI